MNLQKQEAINRMKTLRLSERIITKFEKFNCVMLSENLNKEPHIDDFDPNIIRELSTHEKDLIEKLQYKVEGIVYHVIKTRTNFGVLYNILFVSDSDEEWQMDREDLLDNRAFAYVANVGTSENAYSVPREPLELDTMCSEFGSIGVEKDILSGTLIRTW